MEIEKKIIFVVGTGRSGTHLIGRVIASHPQVHGFIEEEPYFELSVKAAIKQNFLTPLILNRLSNAYKKAIAQNSDQIVLDKSHTNIWHIQYLSSKFPGGIFVGIIRDVYSTVSSMLLHKGIMYWFENLPLNKPSKFLGINKENLSYYASLPIESQCALRWLAHKQELIHKTKEMENLLVIDYENLINDQENELNNLAGFLGLSNEFKPEHFNIESLSKWKNHLNEDQIANINNVLVRSHAEQFIPSI